MLQSDHVKYAHFSMNMELKQIGTGAFPEIMRITIPLRKSTLLPQSVDPQTTTRKYKLNLPEIMRRNPSTGTCFLLSGK